MCIRDSLQLYVPLFETLFYGRLQMWNTVDASAASAGDYVQYSFLSTTRCQFSDVVVQKYIQSSEGFDHFEKVQVDYVVILETTRGNQ